MDARERAQGIILPTPSLHNALTNSPTAPRLNPRPLPDGRRLRAPCRRLPRFILPSIPLPFPSLSPQSPPVTPSFTALLTYHTPGTNLNGVKIKVSRFRVEQRKLYDEYGWVLPDGGARLKSGPATPKKATPKKATPKKRTADDSGDAEEGETETPVKKERKPRAKKAKKEEVKEKSDEEVEEVGGVKQEVLDEEV
jgi:hypothetical protein